jgi:hypothetical protein
MQKRFGIQLIFLHSSSKMEKHGPRISTQSDLVLCMSKAKIIYSKFITKAEVMEIVNNSDLDAYGTEDPKQCEEIDQEITPPEGTNYSSVDQTTVLEPQPQRCQKRKPQAPTNRDLGWTQDIYPTINLHFLGSHNYTMI